MSNTVHQQRRHERTPLDLYLNKIVEDEPYMARMRDISPDGLYLCRLLEPDHANEDHIGLEFMLPDSERVIWAVGRVVRRSAEVEEAEGVGVEFVRIAQEDRDLIQAYIDGQVSGSRQAA